MKFIKARPISMLLSIGAWLPPCHVSMYTTDTLVFNVRKYCNRQTSFIFQNSRTQPFNEIRKWYIFHDSKWQSSNKNMILQYIWNFNLYSAKYDTLKLWMKIWTHQISNIRNLNNIVDKLRSSATVTFIELQDERFIWNRIAL